MEEVNQLIDKRTEELRIASLFEHDQPTSIDFLKNLSNTYKEISDEIDAEMEAEDDGEE